MRNYIKPLMIVAAMASSFSALAIQKDITVNASVDSQLDMTQADNTPLPASIDMQYLPGRGLESYRLNTKVWSNSATSNVKVRLVSAAKLTNMDGDETVPMTVILGDKTLSTTDAEFTGTELFPGSIENGSAVLPLTISQTTKGILKTDDHGRRCVTPQYIRDNVRGCPPSDVRMMSRLGHGVSQKYSPLSCFITRIHPTRLRRDGRPGRFRRSGENAAPVDRG